MGRCLDWEACSDRHERSGPEWALKRPMALQVSVFTARGRPRPPRLFLNPCPFILNDWVQPFSFASLPLPPSHFPSFSLLSPYSLLPPPARLLFGLCTLPPPWSMGKRPRKGSSGYNDSERRGCVRKWSVIALCLTSGSAPLQLLDVFNSSLCLLSRHCGGLLKQQPQVATFERDLVKDKQVHGMRHAWSNRNIISTKNGSYCESPLTIIIYIFWLYYTTILHLYIEYFV